MQKTKTRDQSAQFEGTPIWLCLLRGVVLAALVSLAGILLFALLIKAFHLPDSAIAPVTIGLKIASAIAGSFAAVGRSGSKGLIKGLLTGTVYIALGVAIYACFEGFPSFRVLLMDLGMGALAGAVGGIVRSNLGAKTR